MPNLRKIIKIDETLCDGCGVCLPNCQEGALQIIEGKARLISDMFCDGLGACLRHCPRNAIRLEARPAEPYSETAVLKKLIPQGAATIAAHLKHLQAHGADDIYLQAVEYLKQKGIDGYTPAPTRPAARACPGSAARALQPPAAAVAEERRPSQLSSWPIQISLVPIVAPYLNNAHLLIAADCAGFTQPDFHSRYLKGRILLIGCPKLDSLGEYQEKLAQIIQKNAILSITVLHMEVPCCWGLADAVKAALAAAGKELPLEVVELKIAGQ